MKIAANFLFCFLLLNAFFLRRSWLLDNLTGTSLAILSLVGLLLIIALFFFKTKKAPKISASFRSVFHFFALSITFAGLQAIGLVYQSDLIFSQSVQYSLELLICLGFVTASYYIIRLNLLDFRFIFIALPLLGFCVSLSNISSSLSLTRIRRLSDVMAAVNYQANSIAIAATISLFLIFDSRVLKSVLKNTTSFRSIALKLFLIAACACCSLAVFLSGSRQAVASLILGFLIILLHAYFRKRAANTKLKISESQLIGLIFIAVLLLVFLPSQLLFESPNIDISNLTRRFSIDSVATTLGNRISNVFLTQGLNVVTDSPLDLLLGNPTLYFAIARESESFQYTAYHSHNIFLSIYLLSGIFSLMLFIRAIYLTTTEFFKISNAVFLLNKKIDDFQYNTHNLVYCNQLKRVEAMYLCCFLAYVSLVLTFIYASFSGNYTRTFSLFILWGILLGLMSKTNLEIKNHS